MNIIGPSLHRESECEAVLRSLPMWFGIEKALVAYAHDSGRLPTFAVERGARILGFASLLEHFPAAWEIHCIAIAADARNSGHGTALLEHAERWLRERGVRFLQIKTVAATSSSREYAESRAFYACRGFFRLKSSLRYGRQRIQRFNSSRCSMRPSPFERVHVTSRLKSVVVLGLGSIALLAQGPAAAANPYDGRWSVVLVCADTTDRNGLVKGYEYKFAVSIAEGNVRGEYGAPGHPASVLYAGRVEDDGILEITATGNTGRSEYAVGKVAQGTRYGYTMHGRLLGSSGQATRNETRPCTATFVKL